MLPFPIVIYPQSYKDVAISYEMMTCATIIALLCLFVYVLSQQLFAILCPKRNRFVAPNTFIHNARQNNQEEYPRSYERKSTFNGVSGFTVLITLILIFKLIQVYAVYFMIEECVV